MDSYQKKSLPRNDGGLLFDQQAYFPTDPEGSYTGRPAAPWDKPVQDADDL